MMDIILYNIIACLLSILLGYFLGSIPTGVILCRIFYHADPRDGGSKNSGGTNVGRLYGKKIGAATILLDALKTVLPMIIIHIILKYTNVNESLINEYGSGLVHDGILALTLASLGATIGHCWPIFAGFKGGKAAASCFGYIASTSWLGLLISMSSFLTTLKISKHVSLSSIMLAVSYTVYSWVVYLLNIFTDFSFLNIFTNASETSSIWVIGNIEFPIVSTVICAILIIRHLPNIKRLRNGTESKIKWMK